MGHNQLGEILEYFLIILKISLQIEIDISKLGYFWTLVTIIIQIITSSIFLQGVPQKMRHLISFISPSVLMLKFYALHGQ